MLKRFGLLLLLILSLPILLFVYQPSWQLGGIGILLGAIGYTLSPVILFTVLLAFIIMSWNKQNKKQNNTKQA